MITEKSTETTPSENESALQRFNEKKKLFLIVSFAIFFVTLFAYSPNAETSFLPVTSFPCLVVFSGFLAAFFFYVSTIFYIVFFAPTISVPFPSFSKYIKPRNYSYEHEISKSESTFESRDDWYNDSTNPASTIYHETHRNT